MAKMLQVRNVPDDVHEALRRRAAASGMTLSDFVLRELERVVGRPPLPEVLARAARRGGRVSFAQTRAALRDERDLRS
jgi:plasmid stability protein